MEVLKFDIPGLILFKPKVFTDARGYFMESFNQKLFHSLGIDVSFVQDNESQSEAGTLRGLHFQAPPFAQGKLVRVISGAVFDVAVDIRKGSPTYGKHVGVNLDDQEKAMLWIPEGFAHGFYTLKPQTIFAYKCTHFYNKASEGGLAWNDAALNIQWPLTAKPILSDKDQLNPTLDRFQSPFSF